MVTKVRFVIHDDGRVESLYTEAMKPVVVELGARVSRISRIEPCRLFPRLVFRLLRSLCDDDSRLADWTRNWKGQWRVNFAPIGGRIFDRGFKDRRAAIDFEIPLAITYIQEGTVPC